MLPVRDVLLGCDTNRRNKTVIVSERLLLKKSRRMTITKGATMTEVLQVPDYLVPTISGRLGCDAILTFHKETAAAA